MTWNGGSASKNLGTGVMIEGGKSALSGIEVCDTFGAGAAIPPFGVIVAGDVPNVANEGVTLTDVNVCNNDGVGVLVYRVDTFALLGSGGQRSTVNQNVGVGLLVAGTPDGKPAVTVKQADFEQNKKSPTALAFASGAPRTLGDGVELVSAFSNIAFEDVNLQANERAQLFLDMGKSDVSLLHANWEMLPDPKVTVTASGNQFGARCQGAPPGPTEGPQAWLEGDPSGWDKYLTRHGTAATNDGDATRISGYDYNIGSGVAPCSMPNPAAVQMQGLGALGVP